MGDSTEHSYTIASAHDRSSVIHHPHLDPFTEAETSTETSPDMPSPAYLQNNKTLRDLSGKWVMSKSLSVGIPKALEIQGSTLQLLHYDIRQITSWTIYSYCYTGYPSPTRKALLTSPIYLTITQSHYPSQLLIRTEILRQPRSNYSSPSHSPSRAGLQQQVTSNLVPPSTTERWYPPQKVGQWSEWTNGVVEVPVVEKEKSWNMNSQTSDRRVLATRGRCRWVRGSDFEHKEGIGYLTEGLGAYSSGHVVLSESCLNCGAQPTFAQISADCLFSSPFRRILRD